MAGIEADLVALLRNNNPPTDLQARRILSLLSSGNSEVLLLDDDALKEQTPLGTILSPVRRIPSEILSEIFLRCCDESFDAEDPYVSILDPREAPMLLTHIASFWRTTAQCTPTLWNRISVTSSEHSLAGIRTILERSGSLPLEIMLDRTGPLDSRASFLPLFWDFHDRIEVLSLDLPASHLLPNILPIQTRLPLLRLLDLVIEESEEEDGSNPLPAVLDLFREAPELRELEFSAKYTTEIRMSAFPWAQLTSLLSVMAMDTNSVHGMLRRCPRLESCTFGSLEASDVDRSRVSPSTFSALHSLELTAITDGVSTGFFESLTFPALKSLNLSFAAPIEDLLGLHARCQFNLQHLTLDDSELLADEITQFLRLLPSLETLSLAATGLLFRIAPRNTDNVFKIFTYSSEPQPPALCLPHHTKLTLDEPSDLVDERAVAALANSLRQYPGSQNLSLPSLKCVHLRLEGPKYYFKVEDLLAEVSAAGYIVDHCMNERK